MTAHSSYRSSRRRERLYMAYHRWRNATAPLAEDSPLRPAYGLLMGILFSVPIWALLIAVWVVLWVAL